MRLRKVINFLNRRKDGIYENCGFIAGSFLGILISLFEIYTLIVYKDLAIEALEEQLSAYAFIEINTYSLYILTVILTPILVVFIHMILGILFGLFISKKTNGSNFKILTASLGLGILFGLITSTYISRIATLVLISAFWTVFGLIQILLISKMKNEK